MAENQLNTAASRYAQLETDRLSYLTRARDASKLTIPSLIPPDGCNAATKLDTPFQSVGARGVNNLSSKLLLALLPPNAPFFRLKVDQFALQQSGPDAAKLKTDIEKALADVERAVTDEIETTLVRVAAAEALKHLIVGGNVLLHVKGEDKGGAGGVRMFPLASYAVKRDPSGNVLEIVTKESIAPTALPQAVAAAIKNDSESNVKSVDLYTYVCREGDNYTVYQECKGIHIPGSDGSYPLDKTPWIPLRFSRIDGEDYGRGFVEEYYGDLKSLEVLCKAIVEGSAAAAKVLFLVKPNGTTSARVLAEAPNGAIKNGNAEDVTVLQLDKFADFRIAKETIDEITQRLSFAFMLNTSVQRSGERVTAEEIRFMAGELEDALGGVYSILSQEFQLPLVNRLMAQMQRQNRLPRLPGKIVRPAIVTGLEALGRGHDLTKLDLFINGAIATLGPQVLAQYVNFSDYLTRRATAVGLDAEGLIRTDAEVQQAQQAAQLSQIGQTLGPNAVKTGGDLMKQQMQINADQAQPPTETPTGGTT